MINLTDQVVLITGASRGIGAACAVLFAKAGAHVGIAYRSHDDEARAVQAEGELKCVHTRSCYLPRVPRHWEFKIAWMVPEGKKVTKALTTPSPIV